MNQTTYKKYKSIYLAYMQMKTELEDWHGVSDAANDLRELDARYAATRRSDGGQDGMGINISPYGSEGVFTTDRLLVGDSW